MEEFAKEKDIFRKAAIVSAIIENKGLRLVELSRELGVTSSYLCHLLRLKKIPDMIVDGYYGKMISSSHIHIISRLNDPQKMVEVYERILSESLTVQQTDEAVRSLLYQVRSVGQHLTEAEKKAMSDGISKAIPGAEARIVQTRIKARLQIEMKGDLNATSEFVRKTMEKLAR